MPYPPNVLLPTPLKLVKTMSITSNCPRRCNGMLKRKIKKTESKVDVMNTKKII